MYTLFFLRKKTSMNTIINCPHCNFQYLAGEIFNPKHFLGQPKEIVRNSIGEILGYEGIIQDLTETYICENCDKEFKVTARMSFIVDTQTVESTTLEPKIRKISLF